MIVNSNYLFQIYYKKNIKIKLGDSSLQTKIAYDELIPEYDDKNNKIIKDINIKNKLLLNNNNKQIEKKYESKFNNNLLKILKSYHIKNIYYLCHNLFITSLITMITLFFQFPIILTKENKIRELNKDSEIIISIRGSGEKYVLNQYYNRLPSQVFINNNEQKQISEVNLYN